MSFGEVFSDVFDLVADIFTLGGHSRLNNAKEAVKREQETHAQLASGIQNHNTKLQSCIRRLKSRFVRTRRNLNRAHAILFPPCLNRAEKLKISPLVRPNTQLANNGPEIESGQLLFSTPHLYLASGVFAGTSASILAWNGVQIIGIASTGTAIVFLHGAAASSAGWAWFGGGSLATGGGGMAAGHIVLPVIGVVTTVAVSAYMTHKKASELNRIAEEISRINSENRNTLSRLEDDGRKLLVAELKFNEVDDALKRALLLAKRRLFRFGWLSRFKRYIVYHRTGGYYTVAEQEVLDGLRVAVQNFMKLFGVAESG